MDTAVREPEQLLIPVPVAARMLGISKAHAWKLVSEGTIPSMRLGYRVLVPRQAMLDWIAESTGYTTENASEASNSPLASKSL